MYAECEFAPTEAISCETKLNLENIELSKRIIGLEAQLTVTAKKVELAVAFDRVSFAGTNVVEATNFASRSWLDGSSGVLPCTCPDKKRTLEMMEYLKFFSKK